MTGKGQMTGGLPLFFWLEGDINFPVYSKYIINNKKGLTYVQLHQVHKAHWDCNS